MFRARQGIIRPHLEQFERTQKLCVLETRSRFLRIMFIFSVFLFFNTFKICKCCVQGHLFISFIYKFVTLFTWINTFSLMSGTSELLD